MVAYSFQPRFVAPILAGTKAQTIRGPRRRHARSGEQLQLYTGMRTKACKLIGRPTCLGIDEIRMEVFERSPLVRTRRRYETPVDIVGATELDAFARRDGFEDWLDMVAFWEEQHPEAQTFVGVLIRWDPAHFAGTAA